MLQNGLLGTKKLEKMLNLQGYPVCEWINLAPVLAKEMVKMPRSALSKLVLRHHSTRVEQLLSNEPATLKRYLQKLCTLGRKLNQQGQGKVKWGNLSLSWFRAFLWKKARVCTYSTLRGYISAWLWLGLPCEMSVKYRTSLRKACQFGGGQKFPTLRKDIIKIWNKKWRLEGANGVSKYLHLFLQNAALLRADELINLRKSKIKFETICGKPFLTLTVKGKTDKCPKILRVPLQKGWPAKVGPLLRARVKALPDYFAMQYGTKGRIRTTYKKLAQWHKEVAKFAGRNPATVSTHSGRIGGALQLIAEGKSSVAIASMGRWESPKTIETYVKQYASLMPFL